MIETDEVSPEIKEKKRIWRLRLSQPLYGASPLDAFARFFFKYGQFSGRASRSEYWYASMWLSAYLVVCGCCYALFIEDPSVVGIILLILMCIGIMLMVAPFLSLTSRRYHDAGFCALWMLIGTLISLAGILVAGSALTDATVLILALDHISKAAAPVLQEGGSALQNPSVQSAAFISAHSLSSTKEMLSASLREEERILFLGFLIMLPGQIVDIIFCLLPSRQKGVRFDVPRLPFEWTITKESYLNSLKRKEGNVSGSLRQD
ncbi:MAG: DUF805 domain-containing protein [Aeriscardovia sp.]|nr:DUF805 domain-containing protein [Aeriscardovia sp.]